DGHCAPSFLGGKTHCPGLPLGYPNRGVSQGPAFGKATFATLSTRGDSSRDDSPTGTGRSYRLAGRRSSQRGRWGQGLTAAKMAECRWVTPELVGQFEL